MKDLPTLMHNQASTLIGNGNTSSSLDLDRIARFQGFDPVEFRAVFARLERQAA